MRYVLDSSVALKWLLPEADSAKAIRLRDEYSNGLHELLAPDIFPSEIANGPVSAKRRKRIRTGESVILLNDILSAAPALHPRSTSSTFTMVQATCSVAASMREFRSSCRGSRSSVKTERWSVSSSITTGLAAFSCFGSGRASFRRREACDLPQRPAS